MNRRELILTPVETTREILGNNRRAAYAGLAIATLLYVTGNFPNVAIPSWWPVVPIAVGVAYFAARWAAGKILDLIPDPEGILLIEFDDRELGGGKIWELSEDDWENLRVIGDLHQWDRSPRRVYEVVDYNREYNVAVGNWRESKPGSAIAAERTVDDALAAVCELREDLEPDVAKARETRRRVRGIVRALDKERAEAQQQILDDHLAPDLGSSRTVSDVIDDELPDELHPDLQAVDLDDGPSENGDTPDEDSEEVRDLKPVDLSEWPAVVR